MAEARCKSDFSEQFMESSLFIRNLSRGLCLLLPAACLLLSGCDQQQQLEKQVEGVATSVQEATALTVERTLQETLVASQTGGATLRVKTALTVSSRLDGAQIDVELQGQKIILSGSVQTAKQKAIAHSIAQNTLDPKFKVVNRLTVPNYSPNKLSHNDQSRRALR